MKHKLHWIFNRYMAPAGDGKDLGGGGAEDRGDNFEPTDDEPTDVEVKKPAAKAKEAVKDPDAAEDDADDADGEKAKAAAAKAKEAAAKDGEEDPDDKDPKKDTRLPLSRHKAILAKEREAREALETKLAQYEKGNQVAVINEDITKAETKVASLDEEYTKLITDGEHGKAAAKMQEIRKLEREIADAKGDLKAAAATAQAVEKVRYDTTVDRLEAAYPVLDPQHDDHDAEKTQDVLDLASTYRTRGLTPAAALQKAAKTLLGAETKKQTEAIERKARVDEDEVEAETKRQAKELERKQAQVKKNLDASKAQPADTTKRGADTDKAGGGIHPKDVMKMSQDDFNKLDEETLSKMRGDVLA